MQKSDQTAYNQYRIRVARPSDLSGILAVKASLAIERVPSESTREGFLLGSSPEFYADMIENGVARVIEDQTTGIIKGLGFALPWNMLRTHEVWEKRHEVRWQSPVLAAMESGRPGYIEQLAVVPGPSVRFMAPGLGLALIESLFSTAHTHILATTVLKPVRNRAALKLLNLVHASQVGEIDETYDGIGRILSQLHCVTAAEYHRLRSSGSWQSRVLAYLEKTSQARGVTR
jgi:hypothetical protein